MVSAPARDGTLKVADPFVPEAPKTRLALDVDLAGAGTVGLEILDDLPHVGTVIVPVGGGSVLDGAKYVAAAVNYPGDPWNILVKGTLGVLTSLTLAATTTPRDLVIGLQRLRTPFVDLLLCHRPDPDTSLEDIVWTLSDIVAAGKAHCWGTSQWPPELVAEAGAVADRLRLRRPAVEQPEYSLVHREPFESGYAPLADTLGLGLMTWSPLASGLLSGKYAGPQPDTGRASLIVGVGMHATLDEFLDRRDGIQRGCGGGRLLRQGRQRHALPTTSQVVDEAAGHARHVDGKGGEQRDRQSGGPLLELVDQLAVADHHQCGVELARQKPGHLHQHIARQVGRAVLAATEVEARRRGGPLARDARRAAKVFAKALRFATAQGAVRITKELHLDVDGVGEGRGGLRRAARARKDFGELEHRIDADGRDVRAVDRAPRYGFLRIRGRDRVPPGPARAGPARLSALPRARRTRHPPAPWRPPRHCGSGSSSCCRTAHRAWAARAWPSPGSRSRRW